MIRKIFLALVLLSLVIADQQADLVNSDDLKKFNVNITETLYSGYLPVNEDGSAQFFYMFVLSDPKKPVTLWLNGGPGCSSTQGLFNENGPVNFIHGTANLTDNLYSWSKLSNIIYLESPIGVGFSYGDITKVQTDDGTAKYNLQALISFFKRFSQFQGSDFYISGESYAGIYIPTLSSEILDYNAGSKSFAINLKGIMIGNGCTDITECSYMADYYAKHVYAFYGGHNLISPKTFESAMSNFERCFGTTTDKDQCEDIVDQINNEFIAQGDINPYNVYGDCPHESFVQEDGTKLKRSTMSARKYLFNPSIRQDLGPCSDDVGLYTLFRNVNFLKIMHVDTTKSALWDSCAESPFDYEVDDKASYYLYPKLIQHGLRVWKFSGDIDSVVPITGTLFWINKLQNQYHLKTIVPWRAWYHSGDRDIQRQVGGNFWKIDGLTFVSVRGAGHMVPTDKKQAAYELFRAFLNDEVLPDQ